MNRLVSLGAETIVVTLAGGLEKPIFARFPGDISYKVGERRTLYLDISRALVFDEGGILLSSRRHGLFVLVS